MCRGVSPAGHSHSDLHPQSGLTNLLYSSHAFRLDIGTALNPKNSKAERLVYIQSLGSNPCTSTVSLCFSLLLQIVISIY